jgi:hypothetical protein
MARGPGYKLAPADRGHLFSLTPYGLFTEGISSPGGFLDRRASKSDVKLLANWSGKRPRKLRKGEFPGANECLRVSSSFLRAFKLGLPLLNLK